MKKRTDKEIEKFCEKIWKTGSFGDKYLEIKIRQTDTQVQINVSNMYDYVPLDFKILTKFAKFFDTENITESRYHTGGCETCDYGSYYKIEIYISEETED